ncbi:MAG: hypothetical protein M3N14_06370 [Bacteroidota bacterium]|nr:hypothetical protein [Bacteroidota bacterium]
MGTPAFGKVLIAFLFLHTGFVQQPYQLPKKSLYGKWTSDKALYENKMELSFGRDGGYAEVIRDAKTNKIKSKLSGTFKLINDSTIRIKTNNMSNYHQLHFMNSNLIRFYSSRKEMKGSIPPLYIYNFVRNKN